MNISEKTFGELLTFLREQKDVTLRELARGIGVSAPFLSDVEKGRRAALTAERLEKVVAVLHLDSEEKTALYDAAGKQKNSIPPDLPDYIMEHEYVSAALRTARDLEASEEEWKRFVDDLRRRKG
jgi:transcriptional regulator with XRE-family HTH domain